jgi:hypothetical protein
MEGIFMSKRIFNESFSAKQRGQPEELTQEAVSQQPLGGDPFSPKRLRLLQALADAIFSELHSTA